MNTTSTWDQVEKCSHFAVKRGGFNQFPGGKSDGIPSEGDRLYIGCC